MPQTRVTLVEREPSLAALAAENISANALADRVELVAADLTAPLSQTPSLAARAGTFDHVAANPPYFSDEAGTRSANPVKDGANAMQEGGLDGWARFMAAMAGDLPGFEEASRALFAGDEAGFSGHAAGWPGDIRTYAQELAWSGLSQAD